MPRLHVWDAPYNGPTCLPFTTSIHFAICRRQSWTNKLRRKKHSLRSLRMVPPPSSAADSEEKAPRAFVQQCVFFEKYGGCKFGEQCFYAHDGEMTLGVRNAMQMAQSIGKGGKAGGGVEICFDEWQNEVKLVRVVDSSTRERDRGRNRYDRFEERDRGRKFEFGGSGRFAGRGGRGGFRGSMRCRSSGRLAFISPVRGPGSIFGEDECVKKRRSRRHRSRSGSPRERKRARNNEPRSCSGSPDRGQKRRSMSSSRSSRRSRSSCSNHGSHSPTPPRKGSRKGRKQQRRNSDCNRSRTPERSAVELRSMALELEKRAAKKEREEMLKKQQKKRKREGRKGSKSGNAEKERKRRKHRSTSSSSAASRRYSSRSSASSCRKGGPEKGQNLGRQDSGEKHLAHSPLDGSGREELDFNDQEEETLLAALKTGTERKGEEDKTAKLAECNRKGCEREKSKCSSAPTASRQFLTVELVSSHPKPPYGSPPPRVNNDHEEE